MSDTPATPVPAATAARPVSLLTILFVFALFAVAILVGVRLYRPASVAPQNAAPENLTKELEWRATAESRRATLVQLKADQTAKENSYGWVDQKAGIVRLPIERAMELTAEKYGKKQ